MMLQFSPCFIKIGTYAPFPVRVCLNGHEWAKRQLEKEGINYHSLDNGFLSCENPEILQKIFNGEPAPISYRTAFLMAGETGIISKDLSESLALSAGLRNISVHEYEEIDYKTLYKSTPIAIKDYFSFMEEISR